LTTLFSVDLLLGVGVLKDVVERQLRVARDHRSLISSSSYIVRLEGRLPVKADSFDGQPLTKAPSITPASGQDLERHRLRGLWGVDMLVEPLNETAKQAGLDGYCQLNENSTLSTPFAWREPIDLLGITLCAPHVQSAKFVLS